MGFFHVQAVIDRSRAQGPALTVLLVLAHFADDATGSAWPSLAKLGRVLKRSRSQIIAVLNRLVADGEVERRGRVGGRAMLYCFSADIREHATRLKEEADLKKSTRPESRTCPETDTRPENAAEPVRKTGPDPSGKPDPIIKDQTEESSSTREREAFERFWNAYPRKAARAKAAEAFAKINPDGELLAVMLEAIDRQSRSRQWATDGGRFIPYPTTWLNGRRWQDATDPPEAATSPQLACGPGETKSRLPADAEYAYAIKCAAPECEWMGLGYVTRSCGKCGGPVERVVLAE